MTRPPGWPAGSWRSSLHGATATSMFSRGSRLKTSRRTSPSTGSLRRRPPPVATISTPRSPPRQRSRSRFPPVLRPLHMTFSTFRVLPPSDGFVWSAGPTWQRAVTSGRGSSPSCGARRLSRSSTRSGYEVFEPGIQGHRESSDKAAPTFRISIQDSQKSPSERADTWRMSDGPKILIVDDEPNIRDLLTTSLRFAGFAVRAVGNGAGAISAVLEEEPDLIILDVMLPDMNGFGVTKRLRASGYTSPILFLTAKDDTEDKITGLTVGGDDYVTKPFSLDEIVARIKAILRRTMHAEEDAVIRAGELTMDQDTHEVTVGSEAIELSPTEFKLLRYLMLNPNRVLSKAQILDHDWEYG